MNNKQVDALSRLVESTCGSLVGMAITVLIWTLAGLPQDAAVAGCAAAFIVLGMIDFHIYQKQRYS